MRLIQFTVTICEYKGRKRVLKWRVFTKWICVTWRGQQPNKAGQVSQFMSANSPRSEYHFSFSHANYGSHHNHNHQEQYGSYTYKNYFISFVCTFVRYPNTCSAMTTARRRSSGNISKTIIWAPALCLGIHLYRSKFDICD